MPEEIELKLALPPSALAALRRHPVVAGAEKLGNAVTLDNTYYDTPKLQLKARKVAVRTRRQGRRWLQTVKCAGQSSAGLSQRQLGLVAGLDVSVASPRINQYEQERHMPNVQMLERLGQILDRPLPWFYATDDALAELILRYHQAQKGAGV